MLFQHIYDEHMLVEKNVISEGFKGCYILILSKILESSSHMVQNMNSKT